MRNPPYCKKIQGMLDAYHDGLLSSLMASIVQKHLETCDGCRQEHDLLAVVVQVIRNRPTPDVSPALLESIAEKLNREPDLPESLANILARLDLDHGFTEKPSPA